MIEGMIGGAVAALFFLFLLWPTSTTRTIRKDRNRAKMELFIVLGGLLVMWFLFTGWLKQIFRKKKNDPTL